MTFDQIETWARDNKSAIADMIDATLFFESEAERVLAYVSPIFARLYLSGEENGLEKYKSEVKAANIANGWKCDPDQCPVEAARKLLFEAENKVITTMLECIKSPLTIDSLTSPQRRKLVQLAIETHIIIMAGSIAKRLF